MSKRVYTHFTKAGVGLAAETKNGMARVAVTLCDRRHDNYSRPAARTYLDLRFDATKETLRPLGLDNGQLFEFPYEGQLTRNEILRPIVREIASDLQEREKHPRAGSAEAILQKIWTFTLSKKVKAKTMTKETVPPPPMSPW